MAGRDGLLYTGHCVIRVLHGGGRAHRNPGGGHPSAVRHPHRRPTWRPTSPAVNRCRSPARSPSTGSGGWFVDGIDGDPSNVVGLGLSVTHRLFNDVGLAIGDLWAANPVR